MPATGRGCELTGLIPNMNGSEYPAAFGLSLGPEGEAYVQWHRRDNAGRVEVLRLRDDDTLETSFVPGTQTAINLPGLLSFCSVSVRGRDVYRCRPEEGLGFCKHAPDSDRPQSLGGYPSIAPPVLLRDQAVVGGLDGRLYVVPLSGAGPAWSFATAFGKAIYGPGGGVRRADLLWLRGRIPVCLGAGRKSGLAGSRLGTWSGSAVR